MLGMRAPSPAGRGSAGARRGRRGTGGRAAASATPPRHARPSAVWLGAGRAVDAHDPARPGRLRSGRLEAGADGEPPVRRVERGGDRPGRRRPASSAARRRQTSSSAPGAGRGPAPGRTAPPAGWSCPRRWRRPAPPGSRPQSSAELAIVAEIGQAQLAHGQDCRPAQRPVAASRRRQARALIGGAVIPASA